MSILDSIFGKKQNPQNEANQYLNQIPGTAHQGYDPYVNAGLEAGGKTKAEYEKMFSDPTAFMDAIMKNYKTSEGYGVQKDLLTKQLGNTAAMGGVAGTPLDQLNQGSQVQDLLSKDMQQYLANALGINKTGLEGEENIAGRGFDASKALTDILTNNMTQQGGLAFNNAQQNNSSRNDWMSQLVKALGAGAGGIFGGMTGGAAGILPGAKTGAGIFGGR